MTTGEADDGDRGEPSLAGNPDEAAVMTLIESVTTCIDRCDFDALESFFGSEVVRDYSSLSGGGPETLGREALLTRWATHLPGFDRTRHSLRRLAATVAGDTASAEADVVAQHWVEDLQWTVFGRQAYRLERIAGEWRVTKQTFLYTHEEGDREAIVRAGARAAANPHRYLFGSV